MMTPCVSCKAPMTGNGSATPYGGVCLSCARAADLAERQGELIANNGPLFGEN